MTIIKEDAARKTNEVALVIALKKSLAPKTRTMLLAAFGLA